MYIRVRWVDSFYVTTNFLFDFGIVLTEVTYSRRHLIDAYEIILVY